MNANSYAIVTERIISLLNQGVCPWRRPWSQLNISPQNFASGRGYHKPLEAQLLQLQNELPKLEAEVTHLKIRDLSADEVLREARELYANWPTLPVERKQSVVQSLVEKIVVGTDEIEISLSYLPSSEELTKSQQHLSHTFPSMSYRPHAFGCFSPTGCVVPPLLAEYHAIASRSPANGPSVPARHAYSRCASVGNV
jgi:glutaredoxin-related protein